MWWTCAKGYACQTPSQGRLPLDMTLNLRSLRRLRTAWIRLPDTSPSTTTQNRGPCATQASKSHKTSCNRANRGRTTRVADQCSAVHTSPFSKCIATTQTSDDRPASHLLLGTDGSVEQPAELHRFDKEEGRRGLALSDHRPTSNIAMPDDDDDHHIASLASQPSSSLQPSSFQSPVLATWAAVCSFSDGSRRPRA